MMPRRRTKTNKTPPLPTLIENAVIRLIDAKTSTVTSQLFLAWDEIQGQERELPPEMPIGRVRWQKLANKLRADGGWSEVRVIKPQLKAEGMKCTVVPGILFNKAA